MPIATTLGGVTYTLIAEHGRGVRYEAGSPLALAAALERMSRDLGGAKKMGLARREVFLSKFRAEDVYSELIDHGELITDRMRHSRSFRR